MNPVQIPWRLFGIILAVLVVLVLVFTFGSELFSGAKAKVEARLAGNQNAAVVQDAGDATSTLGARGAAETIIDRKVIYATSQVHAAGDPAAADAAGRAGLCAISPDLCSGDAVQQPGAQ